MKKIVVAGYYGYQNSGDDAILHSICNDIVQLDIETSITVLSNQPRLTMREYGVNAVNRFSLGDVIREVKTCDVLLMGGGSLIQDATSTRSLYYYLGILWIARFYRKPMMLYGNGIGPIKHWFNKPLTTMTLNRVNIITLREHLSLEALKKLHIKKPKMIVTSDPVFNLKIEDEIDTQEIYQLERVPTDKPIVGIMFRSWDHEENYTKKMAKICDQIVEAYDYHIVFVPMKHPADLVVAFEIMKKMKHKATVIEHHYNEEKLIDFMGDFRFILCMRLHALIYGALKNIPMIGFNYDPKVEYYAKELNVPFVENMVHIHLDEIMKLVEDIEMNYDEHQMRIQERVEVLKIEAKKNREFLRELL